MGKATLHAALKLLFPPLCLHCRAAHDLLRAPLCKNCKSYLEVRGGSEGFLITFEGIGPAQSLMAALKSGSSSAVAPLLAAYMVIQYSRTELALPDMITAVPSSRWRRWICGVESSTALAKEFAKLTGVPYLPLLKRPRQLFRQDLLPKDARFALMPEDFQWGQREDLRGKTVLLIDDTITTGSTLSCCSARLFEAAPAKIIKMACVDRGFL